MVVEVVQTQEIQSEPSYAPPCEDSDASAFDYISRQVNLRLEVCQPAIVKSYNREKNTVTLVPAITEPTATGEFIERSELEVPVFSPCGGKFIMNFPLEEGDTGWLLACDRDISLFKQQRTVINPNTYRVHTLEDSFFIPDRVRDFKVNENDKDSLVIQSLDTTTQVVIGQDKVTIRTSEGEAGQAHSGVSTEAAGNETSITIQKGEDGFIVNSGCNVNITCKGLTATVSETATIKAQSIVIDGNVSIKGNLDCDGDVTGNAVRAGSIDLAGHVHGGVENGSGKTGGAE